jgi:lysozyme
VADRKLPAFPAVTPRRAAAAGGGAAITAAMVAAVASWTAPQTAPFEGFVPCAYVDKIGRGTPLTVGFGHTGPDVKPGMCVTKAQALELLERDEAKAARAVASCSPQYVVDRKPLWGAATDFALNTGYYCRGPKGTPTTMAALFAAGRPREACEFYNRYVYSAGKVRGGLVRRRAYFSGVCADGLKGL